MKVFDKPRAAQQICQSWRELGLQIGFVPTMGALHEGHLSLLDRAASENDQLCASIFVNPLQFNDPRDLNSYPASFENDLNLLERRGCNMVFSGTLESFFPEAKHPDMIKRIDPGPCAADLEGTYRPGFFEGVATIVDRLFQTVGNCRAYFGEKDYQQTLVIKNLAKKLKKSGFAIDIVICPTVRNSDGLALSSRNRILGKTHARNATLIYRSLQQAQRAWHSGIHHQKKLIKIIQKNLEHPDINIEYAAVRNPDDWHSTAEELDSAIGLVAVKIGNVRLIDNLRLDSAVELSNT